MDPQQANAVELMLQGVDGHVAALVDDQRRCHEGTEKLLKDMTCLLRRVAADYTAVRAKVAATEKDKSDALECVTNVERTIARREFTLERVSEALVAAQGKRAALERALACASARFAAAELLVNQLKEQLHQSRAAAPIKLHIKLDGERYSTKCSLCADVLTGPVATAEHPSSDSHVVLLPVHDGKSEGGQPAYQCSVCGAGLKAPAAPGKQGGQPEYQCSVCGAGLKAPAKRKRGA